MKWSDILKALGASLEDDIPTVDEDDKDNKDTNKGDKGKGGSSDGGEGTKEDNKGDTSKDTIETAVEAGWFNLETLAIDESKIHNSEVLKAVKALKGQLDETKLQADIDASLAVALKGYKLNVKPETIKKNLDYSKIKRGDDGKIEGALEAIKELEKEEPGFFNIDGGEADKEDDKDNPLYEGFNPPNETGDSDGEITADDAWASLGFK